MPRRIINRSRSLSLVTDTPAIPQFWLLDRPRRSSAALFLTSHGGCQAGARGQIYIHTCREREREREGRSMCVGLDINMSTCHTHTHTHTHTQAGGRRQRGRGVGGDQRSRARFRLLHERHCPPHLLTRPRPLHPHLCCGPCTPLYMPLHVSSYHYICIYVSSFSRP